MEIILKDTLEKFFIPDTILNSNFNNNLVHQVLVSHLSNIRQNTKLNKNRSNVSGSNKKPWNQKGTGRARSGNIRSPIWRSGGVTFGNQVRSYKCKINKKMYKNACKMVLFECLKTNRLIVFNDFKLDIIKTKILYNKIYNYCQNNKTLIILEKYNNNIIKSSNNIYFLQVKILNNTNLVNMLNFKYIIMTINEIKILEKILL